MKDYPPPGPVLSPETVAEYVRLLETTIYAQIARQLGASHEAIRATANGWAASNRVLEGMIDEKSGPSSD